MQGVTPYLMLAVLGAAVAGVGFATAGAGESAPGNPDLGFYLWAKARTGESVDPAIAHATEIGGQPDRERAFIYAAVRNLARSAGASTTAETAIGVLETVRSAIPGLLPR